MPHRPANITQADIARAIRAVQNAGLPVLRVVVRADGIAVETVEPSTLAGQPDAAVELEIVENSREVIL